MKKIMKIPFNRIKQNHILIFLFFIIIITACLRFYQLGVNPPSLTWDEAAWGYNAYSLGIDGRDEFGRFLPHDYLESFGDFKPPMYAYLSVLPVKILGLNEFSTRFASAFFGVLTVLLTYFLVKQIFFRVRYGESYALLSALFLAISPWHIMLSRAAFEANVATFFIVCGVCLFLKAIQQNIWYLCFSAVFFSASFYTFNTPRVAVPLFVGVLAVILRKKLLQHKKQVLIALFIGALLLLPIAKFLVSPQASLRFKEVNIFSDVSVVKIANQEIANDNNSPFSKVIHNRRLLYGVDFLKHYLDEFNPNFLFISGDVNPKFSTQDTGELYIAYIPFLLLGILLLIKNKEGYWWLIFVWLLIGIIPAATARETPHALRTEIILPTIQILIAYGFVQLFFSGKYLQRKRFIKNTLLVVSIAFLLFNMTYFLHGYFVHYPKQFAREWQYGYKDMFSYLATIENNYDQVNMTDNLGRPYIYYLFYQKIGPMEFHDNSLVTRDPFGFVTVQRIGKYFFGKNTQDMAAKGKQNLFIDVPSNVPGHATKVKTFYLPNGEKTLVVYKIT